MPDDGFIPQTAHSSDGFMPHAATAAPPKSWLDHAADYASGVWDNLKQSGQGMVSMATTNPATTIKNIGAAQGDVEAKAESAFKRGDYAEGVRHVINYLLPVIGPQIDQMGDEAQNGNLAHALGGATSLGMQLAAPGALQHPAVVSGIDTATTATKAAATRMARAVSAAVPEVGSGIAKMATGAVLSGGAEYVGVPHGYALGAIPAWEGARQIWGGIKKGAAATRAAAPIEEVPEVAANAPPISPPEIADPHVTLLDQVADGNFGKPYAKLKPEEQAIVDKWTAAVENRSVVPPRPIAQVPNNPPPAPEPEVPGQTTAQRMEAELAARRASAPAIIPNAAPGAAIGGQPAPIGVNVPLRPPLAATAAPAPVPVTVVPVAAAVAPEAPFALPQATQALANRLPASARPPVPLTVGSLMQSDTPAINPAVLEKSGTTLNWETGGKTLPPAARVARAKIADVAAQAMYKSGITSEMLSRAEGTPVYETVKAGLARIPGISKQGESYAALSEDTMDIARDRLAELEKAGPSKTPAPAGELPAALRNNPKAAEIARKLAAEMTIGDMMK